MNHEGNQIGYTEAVERLEQILAELEAEDVDVDLLAAQVRTAVDLIRLCRERIAAAEIEVARVVSDLEDEKPDAE